MDNIYEFYMDHAITQAEIAREKDEVPIGCVIVKDDEIIALGHNNREYGKNALAHAEIVAINQACKKLDSWRLHGCTLYVTLEPCPMCMGAIINSRIDKVVFGAFDKKAGCCSSVTNFNDFCFNHKPEIVSAVKEQECATILSNFFTQLRKRNKQV